MFTILIGCVAIAVIGVIALKAVLDDLRGL